jgi:hypothetical protein
MPPKTRTRSRNTKPRASTAPPPSPPSPPSQLEEEDQVRIQDAIAKRELLDRVREHAQYHGMYVPALSFIKENMLLLYGGYAINSILPLENRFYDAYELPDLDCITPTPLEHAEALANLYIQKGYASVEVQRGMKQGTYKLSVDMRSVVDFKYVPESVFKRFQQMSKAQRARILQHVPTFDLPVVPIDFLRYSIHHEISEPNGQIARWTKVYKRFVLLHTTYPFRHEDTKCIERMLKQQYTAQKTQKVLDTMGAYIAEAALPSIGTSALILFLRDAGVQVPAYTYADTQIGYYEVLSESAMETVADLHERISKEFPNHKFTIARYGEKGKYEHNVPFYTLFMDGKTAIVTVHQSVSCHAIVKIGNVKVGNVDTVIRFLFHYIFTPISSRVDTMRKCMINALYNLIAVKAIRSKTMFSRFNLDCYGYQASLDSLRRARQGMGKRILLRKEKPI